MGISDHIKVEPGSENEVFYLINLDREDEAIAAVQRGAEINKPSGIGINFYPLHAAVRENMPRLVRVLLEAGADPWAVDETGDTPLWYAKQWDVLAPIAKLLEEYQNTRTDAESCQDAGGNRD